jgi:glycosyltransferase involved in cell wall biosynthesis
MKRKILIVAPYCLLPGETGFNRFLYLADFLSYDFDVTLVTSSFRHLDKTHRPPSPANDKFTIQLLDEPGYKNNVSLGRLYSHSRFVSNFKKWFQSNHDYDLVYSAYPLIETNIILGRKKSEYEFKLIIDVQDVWPESISSFVPFVSKLPLNLLPFWRKANRAYSFADAIVAVSSTYLQRAMLAGFCELSECVFIGSDLNRANAIEAKVFGDDVFHLIYIGTLSHSYDVETVIESINFLRKSGVKVELHVLGGGPDEARLKNLAGPGIVFYGYVDYSEMFSILKGCSLAVNSLSRAASQSVTNKLSDYLSIGIPIINSQDNKEVLSLLKSVDHANYQAGSVDNFVRAFNELYSKREKLSFKPNSKFDRAREYPKIKKLINHVLSLS